MVHSSHIAIEDTDTTYDFDGQLRDILPPLIETTNSSGTAVGSYGSNSYTRNDPRFRTQVCSYWLIGLCQKGSECGHLHKLDKSKCSLCPHAKLCRIKNCLLQHIDEGDKIECLFYKQGFCLNGPMCKFRHAMKTPEECPVKANFDETVQTMRGGGIIGTGAAGNKRKNTSFGGATGANAYFRITLCSRWLDAGTNGCPPCQFLNDCHFAHGEEDLRTLPSNEFADDHIFDPTRGKMSELPELPFHPQASIGYFLLQSPDLRSLAIAKTKGVWAVPASVALELNLLLKKVDMVALIFCVTDLMGIYGVAMLKTAILPAPPMVPISPEFPIEWIRSFRCGYRVLGHLKNAEGKTIGTNYSDIMLERAMGFGLCLVFFRKPIWEWPQQLEQAQPNNPLLHQLNPDQLFPLEWVFERAMTICTESGMMGPPLTDMYEENYYTGDIPGFIFGVPAFQVEECFGRALFGASIQMKDICSKSIKVNSPLFLLDVTNSMLFGLFQAMSPATGVLDPSAFMKRRGTSIECVFPVQCSFMCCLDAPPVPTNDPELKLYLGGKTMKIVPGPLTLVETKKLANFFALRCGAMMMGGGMMAGGMTDMNFAAQPIQRGGSTKIELKSQVDVSSVVMYRPPYKHSDNVYVPLPIDRDFHALRRKLLGNGADRIHRIVEDLGCNSSNLRIRLRGIGSAFFEGPGKQELQEPLHFVISAEDPSVLVRACQRIELLCNGR